MRNDRDSIIVVLMHRFKELVRDFSDGMALRCIALKEYWSPKNSVDACTAFWDR